MFQARRDATFVQTKKTRSYTPISIFKVKKTLFDPKLVSLPVRNIFNQISSKFAILILFVLLTLLLIQFFPMSIFIVKNSIFCPKTCISSRSEHLQPNFFKIYNNVLVATLYTSVYTFFSYFNS